MAGQNFETVQKAFGQHIKDLRIKKGWSQRFLAEHTGSTPVSIAKIERGEFDIRLSTLIALAQAFHTSISKLLQGIA